MYKQYASVYTIDGTMLTKSKTSSTMQQQRNSCKAAVIGSKVYCFGGKDPEYKRLNSCEVYCTKSDTWNLIAPFPGYHFDYCSICSFMNKIYVFGVLRCNNWVYDPAQNNWKRIKDCNIKRYMASCTVFQGQCLVIGGKRDDCFTTLKSVEAYDHYLEKWSYASTDFNLV